MDVKVGDRVRFTAKDGYCYECKQDSGKIVTVTKQGYLKSTVFITAIDGYLMPNGRPYCWLVNKSTMSPINIKGKQLEFSFMENE